MTAIKSMLKNLTYPAYDPSHTQEASPHWERWAVAILVAGYLLLTIGFSLGPISESPDELAHYRFIHDLIQYRTLPDPVARTFIQAHQAPLYYVVGIPFLLVLDNDQVVAPIKNPWGGYSLDDLGNDNKNVRLHSAAENFPYTGSRVALAVHLTRLLSILMGLGTVLACNAIFRLLWPSNPALRLAALGFVAFWPQFAWLSSVINNDNGLNLMSALTLLVLLKYARQGLTLRGGVLLGLVFGLALLTKASAVFLAIPIGLALLLDLKNWRSGLAAVVLAAALGLWWYIRNLLTIHSLSGWPNGPEYGGLRPGQSLLPVAWERLPFVYQGLWARFGQVDVPVSPAIYRFFDILLLASLLGFVVWLVRSARALDRQSWNTPRVRAFAVTALFGLSWIAGVVYSAGVVSQGNQGRYLQPGMAAWGALLAAGLVTLIPGRFKLRAALGSTALMASVAAVCLFGYFYPSFRPLPASTPIEQPLDLQYGDAAQLIGMSPQQPHGRPGDIITISLYWRAIKPTPSNLAVYLHSIDSNVVQRDSFPATGNLRSIDWQPAQTWEERYVITIPKRADSQHVYNLLAGLYEFDGGDQLPVTDAAGETARPVIGRIAINGPTQPFTPDYVFGNTIGLAAPKVTRQAATLETCLRWVSLAPAAQDYQMFVHVLNADRTIAAQSDFQPKAGQYPTAAWAVGETIEMCIPLEAPGLSASGWHVAVGLYDLATGVRPSVTTPDGASLPDNQVVISP